MARKTLWRRRYSYLEDYKKGMDGKYVYYGRHYIFKGDSRELIRFKWILGITDILLAAMFVIGGLMDAGAIWHTWYVIVPYALEILLLFVLVWKSVSLIAEPVPLKEYMYKRTVPWFRPVGYILAVVCLVSAIGALICLLTNPEGVKQTGCILFIVLMFLSAVTAFISVRLQRPYTWELDPSEEMK